MKFVLSPQTVLLLFALSLMVACTPDPPVEGEEQIDTVKLHFSNGPSVTWDFSSGNPEVVLDANTTYATVTVEFWNTQNNEDITAEILEEAEDHFVCYTLSGAPNVTITRSDKDANGLELGLSSTWETGEASTGTLTLELRHQPSVKDGTCEPGDSDIEVVFNLVIQ